ncbi:MAG TPA: FIST N-terminal domain-containing protein [Pseudomonadota bacterium]|nr:FIST N-terminal domain-containing protein [Pseudomonadota bacterium]
MVWSGSHVATVSIAGDDAHEAAKEAAFELKDRLGCTPDVVMVFFSAEFAAAEIRNGLWSELPSTTQVLGCSSFAEIGPDGALTHSVTALGLVLPGYRASVLSVAGGSDSYELGKQLVFPLSGQVPDLLILLPDVLSLNATRLLRGIQKVIGDRTPIVGGAPADMGAFKQTTMIAGSNLQTSGAVALALYGPISISAAAFSGYTPVSIPLRATKVEQGNVVLELNGKPALDVYLDFLGPRKSELPAVTIEYPIGVLSGPADAKTVTVDVVRAAFRMDENRGAIVLGGDIPEGAELRILSATRDDVLRGTKQAMQSALLSCQDADLMLLFNCMSRKIILGPRYKEEYVVADSVLPKTVPRIGFYTYGELSPVAAVTQHHESTFTVAALRFGKHS